MSTEARGLLAGLAAVLAASFTGALLMSWSWPAPASFILVAVIFGFPVACLHAALVAAPIYYWMGRRWTLSWPRAAFGGFVAGALPISLLSFFLTKGLDFDLPTAVGAGAPGSVGGLAFRAVRGARPPSGLEHAA